jgi:hypothetical protein
MYSTAVDLLRTVCDSFSSSAAGAAAAHVAAESVDCRIIKYYISSIILIISNDQVTNFMSFPRIF